MRELENMLRHIKPQERSELARHYAVTITELEKVLAYFKVYIVESEDYFPGNNGGKI
jgi:hypothetical protein